MPRLIVTQRAVQGLERCRKFLLEKGIQTAGRAALAIERQFSLVQMSPVMGRPFSLDPELRELIIEFGDSGYVALYRFEPKADAVYILAFRHQKEAGY
ncbi:type II toxin-antitoxin system RelE/ParE family toxin [Pseudomonas silvicola]|nr:type II toxin-antitoxin system RelE/ParE family toxin [Pseudomonas silvicola]